MARDKNTTNDSPNAPAKPRRTPKKAAVDKEAAVALAASYLAPSTPPSGKKTTKRPRLEEEEGEPETTRLEAEMVALTQVRAVSESALEPFVVQDETTLFVFWWKHLTTPQV